MVSSRELCRLSERTIGAATGAGYGKQIIFS
jgi:hypothetical protein